jgi:hypothetical protein
MQTEPRCWNQQPDNDSCADRQRDENKKPPFWRLWKNETMKGLSFMIENKQPLTIKEWRESKLHDLHEKKEIINFLAETGATTLQDAFSNMNVIIENAQYFNKLYDEVFDEEVKKGNITEDITFKELRENGKEQDIRNKAINKLLNEIFPCEESSEVDIYQQPIANIIRQIDNNIALITDKKYSKALIPSPNPNAYIETLEEKYFSQLEFNVEDGTMRTKDNSLEPVRVEDLRTRRIYKDLDLPLLRSLYTVIYKHASRIDTDTVTVSLPTLAAHMGINVRGERDKGKANDFMKKINEFKNVIGVFDNGSFYQLLVFLGYNKNENTITFGSPYMNRVLLALHDGNRITRKGTQPYIKPHHSFLIHGNIANERNKAAVEIVVVIVRLLAQRGEAKKEKEEMTAAKIEKAAERGAQKAVQKEFSNEPVAKKAPTAPPTVTKLHKSFRGIVDEIPILSKALNDTNTTRLKNQILKRAFSKAYTLLREKTDIYDHYFDLKIPEIIPTSSTLDSVLNISHNGVKKDT